MKILNGFLNIASSIGGVLSGTLVVGLVLIITYDFGARYLFNMPTIWSYDVATFSLAAAVFLGLAYTFYRKAHIRMELVTSHLPRRLQTWLRLVTYVIGLGFVGVLASQAWTFALHSCHENARSTATFAALPLCIPQLAMASGLSLLWLVVLLTICRHMWLMRREEGSSFSEAFSNGGQKET